ncbi:MAG: DUF523 domain-containing protein [Myxococcales bacterium]|nr:DUF523 domain-containing protein [Myxococcales bacterium]
MKGVWRVRLARGDRLACSACLLGELCRYDGVSKPCPAALTLAARCRRAGVEVVAVCPEVLGGLACPRPGAYLAGGDGHAAHAGLARVRTAEQGRDVTAAFLRGARRAFERATGARFFLLKARSPSCGLGRTEIDGALAPGDGVLAALLVQAGIACMTDEDLSAGRLRIVISRPR